MNGHAEHVIEPWDKYNQELAANAHPAHWVNPTPAPRYNLVVIGGGTAGLVTAAGATGLGAKVALIEKHLLGGDCLNVGCVPSKALIRSSRSVAEIRRAEQYGIRVPSGVEVDFPAVMERLRRLRAGISPHDSAKRFTELGVDVFLGSARFANANTVEVAGQQLSFKRAVIATGARAVPPAIEGLNEAGYLTNENVFSLTERPNRLAVIGGGPVGCELAQAFARLGSEVTLFHKNAHLLDHEDVDAAALLQQTLQADGVRLVLNVKFRRVERGSDGKTIHFHTADNQDSVTVDEILIGIGRAPNVEHLNLEGIGVEYDLHGGITVNDYLQTTNPNIYAAGDVCLKHKFTHAADFTARIVIQNALFLGRKKLSALTIPWATYTDPEIAHVGLYEHDARIQGIPIDTYLQPLSAVDRAIVDGETNGFVKIHVAKGTDKILGATIVAKHAGDLISEISVAMAAGMGLGKLANVIHPYPTQAEAIRKCGDQYNRTRLTPMIKQLFSRWLEWTR